ncbi:hypothetical protein E3N88_38220 [Mikania micrantha]|uniref:Uncharacterized protein n=1 Tax=Mikania micrantha TaxID=192012 RepID=A0A5N6LTE2_9ASTR|nr:hypothetical protein E3N88_38220 [Mikania micrantha]
MEGPLAHHPYEPEKTKKRMMTVQILRFWSSGLIETRDKSGNLDIHHSLIEASCAQSKSISNGTLARLSKRVMALKEAKVTQANNLVIACGVCAVSRHCSSRLRTDFESYRLISVTISLSKMISFGLVAKGGEPDAIVIAFGGTQETRWLLQWIGPKSHKQDIIKDLYTKNKANHAGLIRNSTDTSGNILPGL